MTTPDQNNAAGTDPKNGKKIENQKNEADSNQNPMQDSTKPVEGEVPVPFDEVEYPWESLKTGYSGQSFIQSGAGGYSFGRNPSLEHFRQNQAPGSRYEKRIGAKQSFCAAVSNNEQPTQAMRPAPGNLNDLPTQANLVVPQKKDPQDTQPNPPSASWMSEQPTKVIRSTVFPTVGDETTPQNPSKAQTQRIPPAPLGGKDALPNHVDEVDSGATQVSRSAINTNKPVSPSSQKPSSIKPNGKGKGKSPAGDGNGRKKRGFGGCLIRAIIIFLFLVVLAMIAAGAFLVYQYFTIAATLPSVDGLKERASQFETTRIYDRNNQLLYELLDPNAGRRTYIPLSQISPYVIAATVAVEDKEYYNHPGFDPIAIARALVANYTTGEVVSGASTITQQLARALLLDPE